MRSHLESARAGSRSCERQPRENEARTVFFFSRGKGRGHAIPDAAIAEELLRLAPKTQLVFVSYGTGAATLRLLGWDVHELDLPENNPVWDTIVQVVRVLQGTNPALIISHEEFAVVPISKALGFVTLYLTDFFLQAESAPMQALKYADEVILLDDAGYQDVPPYLVEKTAFVGPVLRKFTQEQFQKDKCRTKLGIHQNSTVIVVIPGSASFHSEEFAPILNLVLAAYDFLELEEKRLVWVAGHNDFDLVQARFATRRDLFVMEPHTDIASTMRCADIVITKGNRITVLECEALGIPSISISFGNNPIDDNRISRVRTNTTLRGRGLRPEQLHKYMCAAISAAPGVKPRELTSIDAPRLTSARRLIEYLNKSS
jgi:hypothetical protein